MATNLAIELEGLIRLVKFLKRFRIVSFCICSVLVALFFLTASQSMSIAVPLIWLAFIVQVLFFISHFRLINFAKILTIKARKTRYISEELKTLVLYS